MERSKGNKKIRKGRKNIFTPAVSWLVRWLLRTFHSFSLLRQSRAGFVIPTALMLLLVMSLVISSMLIRTSQRTQQVIGERQVQFTENAATPAIERAKAKIEYLFKSDPRLPVGVPSEAILEALMLNDDPYTLPGEERLEIPTDDSGSYTKYNAWSFTQDTDGDGDDETVIYSILMRAENDFNTTDTNDDVTLEDVDKEKKAYAQVSRSGPLGINSALGTSRNCDLEVLKPEEGWYAVSGSSVRKNFQVNAVVVKGEGTLNPSVATLEYHQDRQVDKGNKWGAWFLYDLAINPGPKLRFNGALHTEGSIMVGTNSYNNGARGFESFLVSSPNSCIFSDDTSEITITEKTGEDANGNSVITYQGQLISVQPSSEDLGARSSFHDPNGTVETIKDDNDSLDNDNFNDYKALILDPVALFTENKFQALGPNGNGSTNEVRDPNWNGINGRVVTKQVRQPFLDDTYRADNRWGPRPSYNEANEVPDGQYGKPIPDSKQDLITNTPNTNSVVVDMGLDGYWERRSRAEGLRLIVGQRLELGNANGWGGSGNANVRDDDPLYPYNVPSAASAEDETTKNLDLQQRTLRDNLAAVQATAVYHHEEGNNGYFPVTVLASTSHPGTSTTWEKSTTFDTVDYITPGSGEINVDTDFLIGRGTNGWEFEPPADNETTFETQYNTTSSDLRKALENLAHFAGDPNGAFPPTQDTFGASGAVVHPYPYLTMWGDFSNLRRIVDDGTSYDNLSIADKSTLHTAAAALGMLAYNIENRTGIIGKVATKESSIANRITTPNMRQLGAHLWQLVDGVATEANPEIAPDGSGIKLETNQTNLDTAKGSMDNADYYAQFTTEKYLEAVKSLIDRQPLSDEQKNTWKKYVETKRRQIWEANQINRDRSLGFTPGVNTIGASDGDLAWNTSDGKVTGDSIETFETACHPEEFQALFSSLSSKEDREEGKIGLALAFCSEASELNQPHYPALYYLFPIAAHNQGFVADSAEEYLSDAYINRVNPPATVTYEIVDPANIALTPRLIGNWRLPISTSASDDNSAVTNNKSKIQGSAVGGDRYLAIQDKAFNDGRQLMEVRALEINLDLLRKNKVATGKDWWLPSSGIVYAFREDAVREDGIARPKNSGCTVSNKTITSDEDCRMNARSTQAQDPPQNPTTGVSPKPVDYYPDPDRRPYGFRLKNGAVLYRGSALSTDQDVTAGMSFISDNPIYIQGDFNLHSTNGTTLIEEFNEKLEDDDDWSDFYDRQNLNTNFARNDKDTWRPTEILGDAVTILSNNFCDGYIEDGLTYNNSACLSVAGSKSSYLNSALTRSDTNTATIANFMREENSNNNSPIRVDRNGNIYSGSSMPFNRYRNRTAFRYDYYGDLLGQPVSQTVNAVIISGVVPARSLQAYGGLENLPRFLEEWAAPSQKTLNIQGAFFQINFSTYTTAPFDQDAWNVSRTGIENPNNSIIGSGVYYHPPIRKWGYDVALQYRPPAPISDRFVTYGSSRNEFYQEMPSEDLYNQLLFCARKPGESEPIYDALCNHDENGGDENGGDENGGDENGGDENGS